MGIGTLKVDLGIVIAGPALGLLDSVSCGRGAGLNFKLVEIENVVGRLGSIPLLIGMGGCPLHVDVGCGPGASTAVVTIVTVSEQNPGNGTNGFPNVEVTVAVQGLGGKMVVMLAETAEVLTPV